MPADTPLVTLLKQGRALAGSDGTGAVGDRYEICDGTTRSGKQVLNVPGGAKAVACCLAEGDHVAVVGQNRRLLVFQLDEVPEMQRGKGVILQRYKDGELSDIKVFNLADGLSWQMGGGRTRTQTDLLAWQGKRGAAGKLPPNGFPRPARFT